MPFGTCTTPVYGSSPVRRPEPRHLARRESAPRTGAAGRSRALGGGDPACRHGRHAGRLSPRRPRPHRAGTARRPAARRRRSDRRHHHDAREGAGSRGSAWCGHDFPSRARARARVGRYRRRHVEGGTAAHLRAVLHDPDGRLRHRARPVDCLRHRQAEWRILDRAQRAGPM
jgi:hypothetical protein